MKYIVSSFLIFTLLSCGTDYYYSSFYVRKDLKWPLSPSAQADLDKYAQVAGNYSYQYSSPSVIATPSNYILVIYEYRNDDNSSIYGVDGQKTVNVFSATSLDAEYFNTADKTVGKIAYNRVDSHGSPIAFVNKDGNPVVLAVGGIGFGQGTKDQVSKISVTISSNNGNSWTDWKDVDTNIFKPLLDEGYNRFYTTSGNGVTLRNGTLVGMIDFKKYTAAGYNPEGAAIIYSKNNGADWELGSIMKYEGNAANKRWAKVLLEKDNGSLLICAVQNTTDYRTRGKLYFATADTLNSEIKEVQGVTGLPENSGGSVGGAKINYAYDNLSRSGFILLHSVPSRVYTNANGGTTDIDNATAISISEDGVNWKLITNIVGKINNEFTSFRQSLTVFKDGTIATAIEQGYAQNITPNRNFLISYRRLSLEYLSSGTYKYEGL